MKRKLTFEQIAARDARRAKFKALNQQIAEMSDTERAAIAGRFGVTTCNGHALSMHNIGLIWFQNPKASVVGGFRQWLNQGRAVKKGEHGMQIWVPIGPKGTDQETGETQTDVKIAFVVGTVFDITQTQEIPYEQAA